jgi:hypothetical protein
MKRRIPGAILSSVAYGGKTEEIEKLAGPKTKMIDFNGKDFSAISAYFAVKK